MYCGKLYYESSTACVIQCSYSWLLEVMVGGWCMDNWDTWILRMRSVLDRSCRGNHNTLFIFSIFVYENSTTNEIIWKKYMIYCCVSTATVVMQTCHSVMLYIQCLKLPNHPVEQVPYSHILGQSWRTYGTCAQNGMQKDFLHVWHSLLSQFFCFFCLTSISYIVKNMCICTHIWLCRYCVWITVAKQIMLQVKHFYTKQEQCEVLTGYLSLRGQPGSDWMNM